MILFIEIVAWNIGIRRFTILTYPYHTSIHNITNFMHVNAYTVEHEISACVYI